MKKNATPKNKTEKTQLKINNYIYKYVTNTDFIKNCELLRNKYNIEIIDASYEELFKSNPIRFISHPEIVSKTNLNQALFFSDIKKHILKEAEPISKKLITVYSIYYIFFGNLKRDFLFEDNFSFANPSYFRILDIPREMGINGDSLFDDEYRQMPIAIQLHPQTSRKDFIEYVKSNWSEIEGFLDLYKQPASKLKNIQTKTNKKTKDMNEVILKNKDNISNKNLTEKIWKVVPNIEYGNVSNYKKKITKK